MSPVADNKRDPGPGHETHHENNPIKQKVAKTTHRRTRMTAVAAILGVLGTLSLALSGICYWYPSWRRFGILLFFAAWLMYGGIICLLLWQKALRDETVDSKELSGVLLPANDPTPDHPCIAQFASSPSSLPLDAVGIFYGSSASWLNKNSRHVVVQIGSEDILAINRTPAGVSVSARVFSADSRIVAEITNDEFFVNPNNYFRISRPDRHSLMVFDQTGTQVLSVRFLNPRVVTVLGVFRHPSITSPVVIAERDVTWKGLKMWNNCSVDSGVGIRIGVPAN
jgi:hypothetical protein